MKNINEIIDELRREVRVLFASETDVTSYELRVLGRRIVNALETMAKERNTFISDDAINKAINEIAFDDPYNQAEAFDESNYPDELKVRFEDENGVTHIAASSDRRGIVELPSVNEDRIDNVRGEYEFVLRECDRLAKPVKEAELEQHYSDIEKTIEVGDIIIKDSGYYQLISINWDNQMNPTNTIWTKLENWNEQGEGI